MSHLAISIDLGGTAIKGGVVSSDGRIVVRDGTATEANQGPDHVIKRIVALIDRLRGSAGSVEGVGVGSPGVVSHRQGLVRTPPNLPGWKEVALADQLSRTTGLRVTVDNDANCAAWGEYVAGAWRNDGIQDMVLLTLGTGIGSGMILGGRLHRGASEAAGEWGHTIVAPGGRLCGCGQRGCLEAQASARSVPDRMIELVRAGRKSILRDRIESGAPVTCEDVVEAAQAEDAVCSEVWDDACRCLAIGCLNIQRALAPQRIVFGGGMAAAGNDLFRRVESWIERLGSTVIGQAPVIFPAHLGNEAGFIGAALNVFTQD